jgi:hypothetical protein
MNLQDQEFGGEKLQLLRRGVRIKAQKSLACRRGLGFHAEGGCQLSKLPVYTQADGTIAQHWDSKPNPGANYARRFWPRQTRKRPRCKRYSKSSWSPTEKYAQSG